MAKKEDEEVKEKNEPKNIHEISYVDEKGWAVKRQSSSQVRSYGICFKSK